MEDIESKSISDWLKKESTQLVTRSLAPQARELQSIDELFLATKKGLKRLYEGGFERCQIKR